MSLNIANCNLEYYNSFFNTLYNQYNFPSHIKLDETDRGNLKNILNNINNYLKYKVDVNLTINVVEKLYPTKYIGGRKKQIKIKGGSKIDYNLLLAIVSLVISIVIIYNGYLEFNEMLNKLNLDKSELQDEIKTAFQSNKDEEITFLVYLFNSFKSFACNLASKKLIDAQNILKDILENTATTSYETIMNTCGGATDISNWIAPTSYNTCVSNVLTSLRDKNINDMKFNMDLVMTQLEKNRDNVYNLTSYGARLGYSSVTYLTYRYLNRKVIVNSNQAIEDKHENEKPLMITNDETKGGKTRTKKMRRNKAKTSKNNKRKTNSKRKTSKKYKTK